jgi:hypothetical protein
MWIGDIIQKFEKRAFTINGEVYYPADVVTDELNVLSRQCLRWMDEDFEAQAVGNYGEFDWMKYYDSSRFIYALEKMINDHNPEVGITWDTINEYLERYCRRKNTKEDDDIEIEK